MRNVIYELFAVAMCAAMIALPGDMYGQTRRTTTSQRRTTTTTSTQDRGTGTSTRRATTTSSRNTGFTTQDNNTSTRRGTTTRTRGWNVDNQNRGTSARRATTTTGSQNRATTTSSQNRGTGVSTQDNRTRRATTTTTTTATQNRNTGARRAVTTSGNNSQDNVGTTTRRTAGTNRTVMQGDRWRVSDDNTRGAQTRTNSNVSRRGLTAVNSSSSASAGEGAAVRRNSNVSRAEARGNNMMGGDDNSYNVNNIRIENNNVYVIPPRERDFVGYGSLGSFWGRDPHYFGYRVDVLPPTYTTGRFFGINYYYYNDVYYRRWRGHYVVCRPPFGVVIDRVIDDMLYNTVTFAFYNAAYHAYSGFDTYSRYIDRQNRTIARNNAIIARQNSQIAMNNTRAQSSYEIAEQLGLAQSYAYADREYYYDDGVFYIVNDNGRYETIVPPAGALVDSLPEDFDTITLGNAEYYRVDDTVYRVTLVGGKPYLEVLGQMYGKMAREYSLY